MTLIIGYIYKNNVHLIADSILTTNSKSEKLDQNSFGELSEADEEFKTKECLNKIYVFGDTFAGGFAGVEKEGNDVLNDLRKYIEYFPNKKIRHLLKDFFINNKPENTEYLFGFTEDEDSYIFHYVDLSSQLINSERTYAGIGNGMRNSEMQSGIETIDKCLQRTNNNHEALISSTSILQSFVLNNYHNYHRHFKEGYGGIINGLFIDHQNVNDSPDTIYVLYSNDFFDRGEKFCVQKLIRDNVIAINTTKDEAPFKLYINDLEGDFDIKKWLINGEKIVVINKDNLVLNTLYLLLTTKE